jgi:hypothetical protein
MLHTIFYALVASNNLVLPVEQDWPPNVDINKFCPYHRIPVHTLEDCYTFWDLVHNLNDHNHIDWGDIRKLAEQNQPRDNRAQDLGIMQNLMPAHPQPQNPPANADPAHVTTLTLEGEELLVHMKQ